MLEPLDLTRYAGITPGKWEIQTGCSWRRIGTNAADGNVCYPTNHRRDNHPDLVFQNGGPDGPDARLIADAPLLLAEVQRLRDALERVISTNLAALAAVPDLIAEVQRLRAALRGVLHIVGLMASPSIEDEPEIKAAREALAGEQQP